MAEEKKDVTKVNKEPKVSTKLLVKASFITQDNPDHIQEGSFSINNITELGKVIEFLANNVKISRLNKFEFETEVVL